MLRGSRATYMASPERQNVDTEMKNLDVEKNKEIGIKKGQADAALEAAMPIIAEAQKGL